MLNIFLKMSAYFTSGSIDSVNFDIWYGWLILLHYEIVLHLNYYIITLLAIITLLVATGVSTRLVVYICLWL